MKKLLSTLASLKLAVILLVLLLLGLAAGTIVESSSGVAVAGRQVYYAWWFIALQAAFAVNVLASIVAFFPWGQSRIGFLTAHGALLVILAGAVTSWFFKVEGQLQLWKGESGDAIASPDSGRVALPFTVKLDDFRVDHYPGTMRPSNFRSDVEVIEPSGARFKAAIWMNHELEHQGWRFFQSSYRQEEGRVGGRAGSGRPRRRRRAGSARPRRWARSPSPSRCRRTPPIRRSRRFGASRCSTTGA